MSGKITLVGAGPGDPELLTVKAVRAIQRADLILYDALVDARVLDLAPRARRIYVGKRRAHHAVAQATIDRLLVRFARRGLEVVRLKGGDPFVFGRGGEEALAAERAGILCEIIPGISSAFAAPGAAGIPVTHRGLASGCLVLTATPAEAYQQTLPALSRAPLTIVLLMALDARDSIMRFLLDHGYGADHPAAIVCGASTVVQWSWTGCLGELASVLVPVGLPGVIVLGKTVELAARLGHRVAAQAAEEMA